MGGELAVSVDAPSGQSGEKVFTFFLPHGFKYSVVETLTSQSRTSKVTHSLSASGINMHYDPSEGTTTQAVLRNHLGNMVAVLASNETNFIDPYKISPYGLTQNGGNAKTNQLVQDKPQYDNFQIVHFGGRVYDLYSRQFLTPDPIVPNHSNISHWSRYSYGYGNPYGHVDPTGYYQIESHDKATVDHSVENNSGDVPEGADTSAVSFDIEKQINTMLSESPLFKDKFIIGSPSAEEENNFLTMLYWAEPIAGKFAVRLSLDTRLMIENNEATLHQLSALKAGTAKHINGQRTVEMRNEMYHVGATGLAWSTSCSHLTCTTTFAGFVEAASPNKIIGPDGIWDIFWGRDNEGSQGELPGGSPFPYVPHVWKVEYQNNFGKEL